jgi:hypothetical protein
MPSETEVGQMPERLQTIVLEKIRSVMDPQKDLVQELSEVLGISTHSAYRRIRSDVYFRLDELEILVKHYNLNFFEFLGDSPASYLFHGANLDEKALDYRQSLHKYVYYVEGFRQAGLININYCGLDITPLLMMSSAVTLTFQEFFWNYTLGSKHFKPNAVLSFEKLDPDLIQLADFFLEFLITTPGTDILSELCLNSLLGQIQYIRETNRFATPRDIEVLHDEIERIVDWYEQQVAVGYRIKKSGEKVVPVVPFNLYNTELFFSDNNFFAQTKVSDFAVVKHNFFSYMFTYHKDFVNLNRELIQTAISKSQPLSATNEKARVMFFAKLREKVKKSREVQ